MNLVQGQRAAKEVTTDLVRLDQRLSEIAASLPFSPPEGHLRGIIHCVKDDLLSDVIDTLTAAAQKSGAELCEEWGEAVEEL